MTTSTQPGATQTAVVPRQPTAAPTKVRIRSRTAFGAHVAGTIKTLQDRHLDPKRQSSVAATMAHLRAAVSREPGRSYEVLEQTQVPEKYLIGDDAIGDDATDVERAKHTAVTLYALHQQSEHKLPMHQDGEALGAAISRLAHDPKTSAEAVWRRFAALGTATAYDEVAYHLRGLIQLLRTKKIGLDYGLLADDLVAWQKTGGPERVRSRWGRDFYRTTSQDKDAEPAGADSSSTPTAKEN